MNTILITSNDTDVGKTRIVGTLAKVLSASGESVQIVKPIECGSLPTERGDAEEALARSEGKQVTAFTGYALPEPLAPQSATGGDQITLAGVVDFIESLPAADWRIIEGAGGVTVPLDSSGADWLDLAKALSVDLVIAVIDDRLGAINQSRLLNAYFQSRQVNYHLWLNAVQPVEDVVHRSNVDTFKKLKLPLCAIQGFNDCNPEIINPVWKSTFQKSGPVPQSVFSEGWNKALQARRQNKGLRSITPRPLKEDIEVLNLADNDYLRLSKHPKVIEAANRANETWGASSSASPLITGYTQAHADLEERLKCWHGFEQGLIWNSGYAANQAVLSHLPQKGDVILADRLIHNSMVAGLLKSGSQFLRYSHCDLHHLETLLKKYEATGRRIFVVTESVFSMDGDSPDWAQMAALKDKYPFFWIVDEAHAIGWYGDKGSGLMEASGLASQVDLLTGTLGKGLGSIGAYTLFHEENIRDYLINFAGEFIYSTYLPPSAAAAAAAAIEVCQSLHAERPIWNARARDFRNQLQEAGWETTAGDSPIVPVIVGQAAQALSLKARLAKAGIVVSAIRPPTVPRNRSRLRLSLNSQLTQADFNKIVSALKEARE